MKKTILTIFLTTIVAVGATWIVLGRKTEIVQGPADYPTRKPLFYQSAMHPWIKSDKPGRCTICGMELTPVYEGEKGFDDKGGENVVSLNQTQVRVLNVQTVEAKIQPLVHTLQVAGLMDDDERRHRIISAYVDARVEKLYANHHGVEVTEGEPLALIYSPGLLQAEREYRQLDGELKKNAASRLQQMGLNPEQIIAVGTKNPSELTSQILAPISGTVVAHDVYEGQYVTMGQKMFEVADFSTMWFMFRAYEQDMPWIEIGQEVAVTTPSKPGRTFMGKVSFIDPNFDETTRSTQIRVELPNPMVDGRRELLHRLYADGAVKVNMPDTLSVPRSAVMQTGPEAVVYIDQGDGAYVQTAVKLGRKGDVLVEVISGLKEGDRVVTNGNLLIDGQAEMNRSFMKLGDEPKTLKSMVALNPSQKNEIGEFLTMSDQMAAALSVDNLAGFNQASEPAMEQTGKLSASLADLPIGKEKIAALGEASHFHGFDDLKAGRAAFLRFISAATAILEPLRSTSGFPEMKVWECPMVDKAVPGAAKKARWIQLGDRPGGNPFFGMQMQDCAKEIKP